jgi:hypothetical protein
MPSDAAGIYRCVEAHCLHRQDISLARSRLAASEDRVDFMPIDVYGNMTKEHCYFISKMLQEVEYLNNATDVIDTFRAVPQICIDTGGQGKEYTKRMHARKWPYFFCVNLPFVLFEKPFQIGFIFPQASPATPAAPLRRRTTSPTTTFRSQGLQTGRSPPPATAGGS